MLARLCLSLALIAGAAHAADPAPRPFTAEVANALVRLGEPQLSPDGKWVVYTLRSADLAKDKYVTDLWRVASAGGTPQRLTLSGEVTGKPRWLPGGEALLFLAARGSDDDKKKGPQLWRLPAAGGEAERLTLVDGGVDDYAVSPDGSRAVLLLTDPKVEPEQLAGWKRKTPPPMVIDRFHFKQDREGYLDQGDGARPKHLHLLDLTSLKTTALTTGEFSERSPAWSPDGKQLAFLSNRSAERDRTQAIGLYLTDAAPAAPARLLAQITTDDDAVPAWSPDGRRLALPTGDEVKWSAYQQWRVSVFDAATGAAQAWSTGLDRGFGAHLSWTPDGAAVLGVVDDDRSNWLARVSPNGKIERLTTGQGTVRAQTQSRDGRLIVLAGGAQWPHELATVEPAGLRRITSHHDAWRAGLQMARMQEVSSTSRDGTVVNSLLSLPATASAAPRLPLMLLIHGGPNGQDAHELGGLGLMRERFVAAGYAVLQVNYRGSSGRGQAFQRAIFADWGNKEVQDLQGAVDWAVKQGFADPARLVVGGWSYGGILTDYLIASDKRFKAAVSGAGSANQISMFGSDQYAVQYEREVGAPWAKPELWMKLSYPFFKADRISTPTLFMGGEKDFNVPIAGSEQMYLALKMLGVPTQLVVYPGQFHGISLPSYQRDVEERFIAWMDRYLKP
jgi:dipeptidyl aminopeptidase/acylaminoacyl peptidase